MAKMDWDRVGRERRMQLHGSAGVDEDNAGGDGQFGSRTDEPYWLFVPDGKPRDLGRSRTTTSNTDGKTQASPLAIFFDEFVSQIKDDESLENCSDQELLECQDTCESILIKVSGLTWASHQMHKSTTLVTNAVGEQDAIKNSLGVVFLRIIDLFCNDEEELNICTNSELQRFHDICETTLKRMSLQILRRETSQRSSH